MKCTSFIKPTFVALLLTPAIFINSGCKKKEGCTDPISINYDSEAEEDDGSCKTPAEHLSGNWNAEEYEDNTGNSENFQYELIYVNDTTFEFNDLRTNKSFYHIDGALCGISWKSQTLDGTGVIDGTIENDNKLVITYLYGTGSAVYDVTLTLTR